MTLDPETRNAAGRTSAGQNRAGFGPRLRLIGRALALGLWLLSAGCTSLTVHWADLPRTNLVGPDGYAITNATFDKAIIQVLDHVIEVERRPASARNREHLEWWRQALTDLIASAGEPLGAEADSLQ